MGATVSRFRSTVVRSASMPMGQYVMAVTLPLASTPEGVDSKPQTRMQVELSRGGCEKASQIGNSIEGRSQEVTRVAVSLEADEVCSEHALENLPPFRQAPENLGRREGRMDKEADVGVGETLAKHLGREKQVVVVHEDEVTRLIDGRDPVGEGGVGRLVRPPGGVVDGELGSD